MTKLFEQEAGRLRPLSRPYVTGLAFPSSPLDKNAQIHPRRRCQGTHVYLLFEGGAVSVPLANEGCVASLNMMTFDGFIDGSTHDLSGFGVDMGQYQALRMHSEQGMLHIFLNEKEVYQMPVSEPAMAIKGVSIHFEGAGAIQNVTFRNTEQLLYSTAP